MRRRSAVLRLLALLGVLLACASLAVLQQLPKPMATARVEAPPRHAVEVALARGAEQRIVGRIARLGTRDLVVRLTLGMRSVLELGGTAFRTRNGRKLDRARLQRGDRVVVSGYPLGYLLLATVVEDTTRG